MQLRILQYKINENGDWDKYFNHDDDLFSKEEWYSYFLYGNGKIIEQEYKKIEKDFKEWLLKDEQSK